MKTAQDMIHEYAAAIAAGAARYGRGTSSMEHVRKGALRRLQAGLCGLEKQESDRILAAAKALSVKLINSQPNPSHEN